MDGIVAVSGQGVAVKAGEVAALMAGKPYVWGGKTTDGFDCSGFVSYVLRQLFPNMGSQFDLNVAGFMRSTVLVDVEEKDVRPGDLIIFPSSGGNPNHVGIVYDSQYWIGSQSSGVGKVKFSNPWWGKRTKKFRRIKSASTASIDAGRGAVTATRIA